MQFCASGCWCRREDSNLQGAIDLHQVPLVFLLNQSSLAATHTAASKSPPASTPHGHDVRLTARCVGLTADQRELRSISRLASRPDA